MPSTALGITGLSEQSAAQKVTFGWLGFAHLYNEHDISKQV